MILKILCRPCTCISNMFRTLVWILNSQSMQLEMTIVSTIVFQEIFQKQFLFPEVLSGHCFSFHQEVFLFSETHFRQHFPSQKPIPGTVPPPSNCFIICNAYQLTCYWQVSADCQLSQLACDYGSFLAIRSSVATEHVHYTAWDTHACNLFCGFWLHPLPMLFWNSVHGVVRELRREIQRTDLL